ncbi:MAG: putative transport system permease protein, partial [Actinomycetota bacterium]|nr:putative transport system permease protein [Actinomycetota bacterium]
MKAFLVVLRFLGVRHFRTRRLRTALTVAGIAAGVALVFSISVINGTLISSARSSVRELAGAAELEVASADTTGLPERDVQEVASIDGVDDVVPVLRVTTKLTGASTERRVLVLGVTPSFSRLFPGRAESVDVQGSAGGGQGLVLSRPLADQLGSSIGDLVAAETPKGPAALNVTGTVSGGAVSLLNGGDVGVMFLPAAQQTFAR